MDMPKEHTLADRFQGLAQELQDMILDFTIAIEPTTEHVTPAYEKPWQLDINRTTRRAVAEMYYKGCTFVWRVEMGSEMCMRWLLSLPKDHHAMIQKIRLWDDPSVRYKDREHMLNLATIIIRHWSLPIAEYAGNLLSKEVFWTNINSRDELGDCHQIWIQLDNLDKMREHSYWSSRDSVVHSWKQPPQGYAWDRSY